MPESDRDTSDRNTLDIIDLKDENVPIKEGYLRDWRGGAEGGRRREAEPDVIFMIPYEPRYDKRK